jgi:DNA-binding LacI/PurR family transcriptional regulator
MTLGYIVLAETVQNFPELIRHLSQFNKPIAVLDEQANIALPPLNPKKDRLAIFSVGYAKTCSQHVARFLLSLGHRRILYLSPYHKTAYSNNRLQGLSETFENAGFPDAVIPCVHQEYSSIWDLADRAEREIPPEKQHVIDIGPVQQSINNYLSSHSIKFKEYFTKTFDSILKILGGVQRFELDSRYMLPLFEKAIAYSGVTSWVAVDDTIALLALSYLRQKNKRVPEDISVVGYDDTPEAVENNLTSYNFNMPSIARSMLTYILNPKVGSALPQFRPVETSGMVMSRGSSGAVAPAE